MATLGTRRRSRDARRRVAGATHGLQALPQFLDLLADDPSVRLQLRLAGPAGADAAAGAREVGPQAGQARQLVLELGQLHLEAALVGLGVLGEDVQDQAAAVEDLDLEQLLQGALLIGRQLVVGHEQRRSPSRPWP